MKIPKIRDGTLLCVLAISTLLLQAKVCHGFSVLSKRCLLVANGQCSISVAPVEGFSRTCTKRFGFFKDMLDKAFENDANLSQNDKRQGQLDAGSEQLDAESTRRKGLTETQEKWRKISIERPTGLLMCSTVEMDFFLTGIPNKDPSNDLFGSRVNISSRDRRIGLALPDSPTVKSVCIDFLKDGKCRCLSETPLTTQDSDGDWKLSEDGSQVRFRIQVTGYTRIIETKGTIQKVYWSEDDDQVRETSTTYSIPSGWLYGEANLSMNRGQIQWSDGILKVEKTVGLLGASTKMVPCGAFKVRLSSEGNGKLTRNCDKGAP